MHFEKQTLKFCHVSATLKIFLIQAFYPEFSGIEARTANDHPWTYVKIVLMSC